MDRCINKDLGVYLVTTLPSSFLNAVFILSGFRSFGTLSENNTHTFEGTTEKFFCRLLFINILSTLSLPNFNFETKKRYNLNRLSLKPQRNQMLRYNIVYHVSGNMFNYFWLKYLLKVRDCVYTKIQNLDRVYIHTNNNRMTNQIKTLYPYTWTVTLM